MKLSECRYGILVKRETKEYVHSHLHLTVKHSVIGMVVGISQNCMGEAIPLIQWQDGEEFSIHHENLSFYEE